MTTLEQLRAARAVIDTPDKWGQRVSPRHFTGTCAINAVTFAERGCAERPIHAAWDALIRALGTRTVEGVFDWNDAPERTHADVMALYDRAIANEEAQEQEFHVEPLPAEVAA